MGVLIDASVFIAHERGTPLTVAQTGERADDACFVSVVTASELLHGVERANAPAVRMRRAAFVESVLERFPLLDVDLAAARTHARVRAALAAGGQLIGPHDLWIAAQALAAGHSVATANVREFARVPGLVVEDWTRAQ